MKVYHNHIIAFFLQTDLDLNLFSLVSQDLLQLFLEDLVLRRQRPECCRSSPDLVKMARVHEAEGKAKLLQTNDINTPRQALDGCQSPDSYNTPQKMWLRLLNVEKFTKIVTRISTTIVEEQRGQSARAPWRKNKDLHGRKDDWSTKQDWIYSDPNPLVLGHPSVNDTYILTYPYLYIPSNLLHATTNMAHKVSRLCSTLCQALDWIIRCKNVLEKRKKCILYEKMQLNIRLEIITLRSALLADKNTKLTDEAPITRRGRKIRKPTRREWLERSSFSRRVRGSRTENWDEWKRKLFSLSLSLSRIAFSLSERRISQISISAFPNPLCQEVKLTASPPPSRGGGAIYHTLHMGSGDACEETGLQCIAETLVVLADWAQVVTPGWGISTWVKRMSGRWRATDKEESQKQNMSTTKMKGSKEGTTWRGRWMEERE